MRVGQQVIWEEIKSHSGSRFISPELVAATSFEERIFRLIFKLISPQPATSREGEIGF